MWKGSGWIIQDGVGLQHPSDCVEKDAQLMPLNTQLSHTSSMNDCINNPFCLGNEWVILARIFFVQNIIPYFSLKWLRQSHSWKAFIRFTLLKRLLWMSVLSYWSITAEGHCAKMNLLLMFLSAWHKTNFTRPLVSTAVWYSKRCTSFRKALFL